MQDRGWEPPGPGCDCVSLSIYISLSSGHDSSVLLCRTEAGAHLAPAVSVGDRVLLPEYGGAKVGLELAGN